MVGLPATMERPSHCRFTSADFMPQHRSSSLLTALHLTSKPPSTAADMLSMEDPVLLVAIAFTSNEPRTLKLLPKSTTYSTPSKLSEAQCPAAAITGLPA